MRKINIVLFVCLFTNHLYNNDQINGLIVPNGELYKHEIKTLNKQLEKTVLMPHEKTNLIRKLVSYFNPKLTTPALNNKKTEVLYGSIIQSYHKLLKDPKKIKIDNEPLARQFQEQVLGKILLHENQFIIRENTR